jgi:hypothetical protein
MTEATSQYLNKPTLTERERRMLDALIDIANIPDPTTKDNRAPFRQARHTAKCMIAEIESA